MTAGGHAPLAEVGHLAVVAGANLSIIGVQVEASRRSLDDFCLPIKRFTGIKARGQVKNVFVVHGVNLLKFDGLILTDDFYFVKP